MPGPALDPAELLDIDMEPFVIVLL